MQILSKPLIFKAVFLGIFFLFLALLFRDPFSQRTLIPNFEPFPDTFHYVTAAESLIRGEGLNITREGRKITPSVPPLYSLALVPFYLINSDPRMFYFTNVLLSLISFILFFSILNKIFRNKIIIIFLLILYATNYFLYWYPTLAMAENLTLPLFLLGILLLVSKANTRNIIFAGFVAIGFYATKFASIPLMMSFSLAYIWKLMFEKNSSFDLRRRLSLFAGNSLFFFSLFFAFEYSRGNNLLNPLFSFASMVLSYVSGSSATFISTAAKPSWFSFEFVPLNFKHYWNSLTGGSERFLWDFTPLVPKIIAIPGLLGLILSNFYKKDNRLVGVWLALMLGSAVIFMSNFYAVDMRYIYHAIPSLLIGFGLFLSFIYERLNKGKLTLLCYILIIALCGYYLSTSGLRIKNQVMLNIKHAETPWYYISVLEMNKYFTKDMIVEGKKPIVISAMPPYLIDFYSNGNYQLLPLSLEQEFRKKWDVVWGPNDYSDLTALYKDYLNDGYQVYGARYGIGNEDHLNAEFSSLGNNFRMSLVAKGCYDQCNIYKLESKGSP